MTDQKTEQKPADHKAIREAARVGGDYTMVEVPDLRALLADLDAMRGALEKIAKAGGWVAVPVQVLEDASEALGNFVSDHGWGDSDMQAMDNLDAYIATHKARTAPPAQKDPT